ncbi:hypothetical protein B0H15DRAFT_251068 [Mycena belliarum]|uniref:Uncharacterized protein n=1 Tax=Mycena belliarum TaxID=1033014 RepID=A0AAD6U482_9AGAR|nr:hypothetical protein B0H15DRAFT_251068 [Mycena belliae]
MRPSSSSLASALTPTASSVVRPNVAPETALAVKGPSRHPSVPGSQPVPMALESTIVVASESLPVASSSKLKRKKKKKEDISKFIQADLMNLEHREQKTRTAPKLVEAAPANKQTTQSAGPSSVPPASSESAPANTRQPSAHEVICVSAVTPSKSMAIEERSLELDSSSITIEYVPHTSCPDIVMEQSDDNAIPEPHPPDHSAGSLINTSAPTAAGPSQIDAEIAQSVSQNAASAEASVSVAAPETLSPSMDDEVNRVLRVLSGPLPSAISIPDNIADSAMTDVTIATPIMNVDEAMPPIFHQDTTTSVPASNQGDPARPMEEATSPIAIEEIVNTSETLQSGPQDETEGSSEQVTLDSPAAFQAIIQTMLNNVNKLITSSANTPMPLTDETVTPTLDGARSPRLETQGSLAVHQNPELHPKNGLDILEGEHDLVGIVGTGKTGIGAATVIARQLGLKSGTISIEFALNQKQADSITAWNNRAKHSGDIDKSLCITLLCFSAADIRGRLESSTSKDLAVILPELKCSWPTTGGLSMNALWNNTRIDLPMAPPFSLPLNGMVDVSPFLVLGKNYLRIAQTRDMSKHWFILCAHHPTHSQLNTVARRRHKEREWTGWLEEISRPLQLPFKIPIEV